MKNYFCLLLLLAFLVETRAQEFPISVRDKNGLYIPLFRATDLYYDKVNKVLHVFGSGNLEWKGKSYPAVSSLLYKDYHLQLKDDKRVPEWQYLTNEIFNDKNFLLFCINFQ